MAKILPIITLAILSPIIAEVVVYLFSPTIPWLENPLDMVINFIMYPAGALLIRELIVRWRKGLASMFLLGAAYALVEEGLILRTIFTHNHPILGILGEFGHWMGVNWIAALNFVIGHNIFSIVGPILLVGMIFPRSKDESWFGNIGLGICFFALVGLVILAHIISIYSLSIEQYIFSILAIIVFVILARIIPSDFGGHGSAKGNTIIFFIFGLIWNFILIGIVWGLLIFIYSPIIVFSAILLWTFVMLIFLARHDWSSNRHRLALIIGVILGLIIFRIMELILASIFG